MQSPVQQHAKLIGADDEYDLDGSLAAKERSDARMLTSEACDALLLVDLDVRSWSLVDVLHTVGDGAAHLHRPAVQPLTDLLHDERVCHGMENDALVSLTDCRARVDANQGRVQQPACKSSL